MNKKHHGGPAPVPPGNRPANGLPNVPTDTDGDAATSATGDPFQDQDQQRRLGGFESAGEHSIQQPSVRNDGTHHSK